MRSVLFVRSGGGLPGLDIHAGIWLALAEAGITPSALSGTSAGAIISGLQASGRSHEWTAGLIASLRDRDVRKERFAWKARIPWIDYWLDPAPIAGLLESTLVSGWNDLIMPLRVWSTDVQNGNIKDTAESALASTPAQAILSSMSICGVFPPVILNDGRAYVDGGVRLNLPLPNNWRDYDDVYLLIATGGSLDYHRKHGILTNLIRNVQIMQFDQIADVLAVTDGAPNVHVVWPQIPTPRGALHFDHRLITEAYHLTIKALGRIDND